MALSLAAFACSRSLHAGCKLLLVCDAEASTSHPAPKAAGSAPLKGKQPVELSPEEIAQSMPSMFFTYRNLIFSSEWIANSRRALQEQAGAFPHLVAASVRLHGAQSAALPGGGGGGACPRRAVITGEEVLAAPLLNPNCHCACCPTLLCSAAMVASAVAAAGLFSMFYVGTLITGAARSLREAEAPPTPPPPPKTLAQLIAERKVGLQA